MNHTSSDHQWFQESRSIPTSPQARLVRVVRHRRPLHATPASSSSTPRRRTGRGTRSPGQYYWHRFFSHQPDLNYDNPEVRRRDARRDALLARLRARRLPARRGAVPLRARRHELREPAGDPRVPEAGAQGRRRRVPRPRAARRGEPVAGRRRRVLRRRRRVPHGVPLPGDAADVHGDAARGGACPIDRDPRADAGRSPRTRSGACSCATTTSSRSRWSPTRSATTCTASTPRTR